MMLGNRKMPGNIKMPLNTEMFGRCRLAGIFSLAVLSVCFT
jgi:hypothetical protein